MKKVLNFFAVIFMTTFLFSAQNSLAQTPCPSITPDCTDTIESSLVMSVPDFPECIVTVNYKLNICQGVFKVYDIRIEDFATDMCSGWINYILDIYFNQGEIAYQSYIRVFNNRLGSIILDELALSVASQPDPSPFYCGTLGAKTITGNYYPGGCISSCIGQKKGKYLLRQISCKGDLCCGSSKTYCVDPQTNQPVLIFASDIDTTGTCTSAPLSDCPKIDGVTWVGASPCFATCTGKTKKVQGGGDNEKAFSYVPLKRVSAKLGNNYLSAKLFPNPVHDVINVYFETPFIGKVSIFNLSGQLLSEKEVENGAFTKFDTSDFTKGTYVLSFRDQNGKTITDKFVVQ